MRALEGLIMLFMVFVLLFAGWLVLALIWTLAGL